MLLDSEPEMVYCIFKEYKISLLLKQYRFASVAPGHDVQLKTLKNIIGWKQIDSLAHLTTKHAVLGVFFRIMAFLALGRQELLHISHLDIGTVPRRRKRSGSRCMKGGVGGPHVSYSYTDKLKRLH